MVTNLPNILTYARILVIPLLLVTFYIDGNAVQWVACALFLAAAVTDFFDGYLARSRNQVSNLGRFLDPIADKLLVASVLLMLVGFNRISELAYLPAVVILCREVLVSGLREFLAEVQVSMPVSRLAKWKTALQLLALTWLLLGDAAPVCLYVRTVGETSLWMAAILTMVTGYDYLRVGLAYMQTVPTACMLDRTWQTSDGQETHRVLIPEDKTPRGRKVLVIAGWSGSGKTTLICSLIPLFNARGIQVSTFKHTHHDIDPDPSGKDSRRHRDAGACEVMLAGPKRAVTTAEWRATPSLTALLARLQPVDLVLIEGLKNNNQDAHYPKIEVWRAAVGKPRAVPDDALLAVAMVQKDAATTTMGVPVLDLDNPTAVATFLIDRLGLSGTREHEDSLLCMGERKDWQG
ncbi:CDP-diacylglycerol--glycerol-3-phosphate 3-phosphatidyltransferase [invertebrate metagenome]|uniref:CDP-diacylglycerol--glycerol-3-phosphate 3-phosphatidyltransferase n=1 Tax=invertebrate metagenome TaxID=1711999 RepID=A0A484HA48_9ZZZZ